ncbi:MAG: hypothetical protein IJE89_00925 [Bacilli bacterium]|nr:hypothetical protein [Bacilli bacterium]
MKFIKLIGLISLICFTFFYTEKIISVSINQDQIMINLKEIENDYKIEPINAIINEDTIVPGKTGKELDLDNSYKEMKKIGYFEKSLLVYKTIYPEISIYNNYNKYIISGNTSNKNVSLIYIINNDKTIDNVLNIISNKNTTISFFIDSSYLNNNIDILNKLKDYEIYNYGNSGIYTKDNLIITNNIINNKTNNSSLYCLFLTKNEESLNTCANNKMLSITPSISGNYNNIKNNIKNGSIINITNTKELPNIIDYIKNKGYNIVSLSNNIKE